MRQGLPVSPHRLFDGVVGLQSGEAVVGDDRLDSASDARLPSDQAGLPEGEHHLVDGRLSDAEMASQVAFDGSPPLISQ